MQANAPSVFVIGDSISIEYGPYLEQALGSTWCYARKSGESDAVRNLDVPRGANGGDSSMVRAFCEELVREPRAPKHTVMLVNCGLHDIKADLETRELQVPIAEYRLNLGCIVDLARQLAESLVWVRTTPVDDELHVLRKAGFGRVQSDVDRYNAIADRVMDERGVPVIDLASFTASLGSGSQIFRDGVHFSKAVSASQGAYIAGWLNGWFSRTHRPG